MCAKQIVLIALLLGSGVFANAVKAQSATAVVSRVEIKAIADGNIEVSVYGSAFGLKPNIVYYNDFRRDALYASVSKTGQLAGQTAFGRIVPTVGILEDTKGFYAVDDITDTPTILQAEFDKAYEEVFLAYSVGIPNSASAPMMSTPESWFQGASWKMAWLLESPSAYAIESEFDLCAPTLVYLNSSLSGNSSKFVDVNDGGTYIHSNVSKWWAWDTLNHLQVVIDGDLAAPEKTIGSFSVVNKQFNYVNFPMNTVGLGDMDGAIYKGPPTKISRVNLPGWFRGSTEDKFQALYSNIYVAAGANYLSRLELTDNKDYEKSSYRRVIFPISWEPTKIMFTMYQDEFKRKGGLFVHYFNEKGEPVGNGVNACSKCPDIANSSASASAKTP